MRLGAVFFTFRNFTKLTNYLFTILKNKDTFELAHGHLTKLCYWIILASNELSHTLHDVHIRCIHFSGRIRCPHNSGHAHYSVATEIDPNYHNATHRHWYKRLLMFLSHKNDAWSVRVVRWKEDVFACVFNLRSCFTCLM